MTDMRTLADRLDIIEACTKLARLVDQRDWPALADLLCPRINLDYSSLTGAAPVELTAAEAVAGWTANLGRLAATQHLFTNHVITVAGDDARCDLAFVATHYLPNPHGEPCWTLYGDYEIALRRVDSRWLIAGMRMSTKWATGNQQIMLAEPEAPPVTATVPDTLAS